MGGALSPPTTKIFAFHDAVYPAMSHLVSEHSREVNSAFKGANHYYLILYVVWKREIE